ncbi:acyl-CoA dehydrogenase family protein [Haloechinothrix salitolerans]|uniref:Acyl-CoA dehydrogenase family protein n=1 Tax=Haloechinothrix salitolerans TaxID=926830 RepID=A0ABW2BWY4_9PSEU
MRWELSDEQELLCSTFRSWLERAMPAAELRALFDAGDPTAFENALVGEGWTSVGFPEDWGGQGGGLVELALLAEQLGRHGAPSAAWLSSAIAAPALAGSRDVVSRVLEGSEAACLVVPGDHVIDGGSGGVRADGTALSGAVTSVVSADRARHLVVPAVGAKGLRLFHVDVHADGVQVRRRTLLDRTRGVADVTFVGAAASELNCDAGEALRDAALRAAVLVAADTLGGIDRMLELAVEYSKQRKQFGVSIGSFQAVKHAASSMLVQAEAARSIVYYAAASVDQGHEDRVLHAATAKAQVTPAGVEAADTALTMHGAIGYTWEHDLHLFYKRAKLNEHLFGGSAEWNERIASALPLLAAG